MRRTYLASLPSASLKVRARKPVLGSSARAAAARPSRAAPARARAVRQGFMERLLVSNHGERWAGAIKESHDEGVRYGNAGETTEALVPRLCLGTQRPRGSASRQWSTLIGAHVLGGS